VAPGHVANSLAEIAPAAEAQETWIRGGAWVELVPVPGVGTRWVMSSTTCVFCVSSVSL